MKSISILWCLCLFCVGVFAQGSKGEKTEVAAEDVGQGVVLGAYPQYPGGEEELYRYIAGNVRYPDAARRLGVEGRVYIQFVVDKTGKVREAEAIRGIGAGCDEEALRVINSMPTWKPGLKDGKPVSVQLIVPISFMLTGSEVEKKSFWQRVFGRGN